MIAICLTPDGFTLRFNTFDRTEDHHTPIKHSQTSLDFGGKINMPRGVNDIDHVFLPTILPFTRDRCRINGNTTSRLFRIKVRNGRAMIDIPHTVRGARVEQDSLSRCGLARVDMSNNPNISNLVD